MGSHFALWSLTGKRPVPYRDPLAFGRLERLHGPKCLNRLFDLRHYLYAKSESYSITTLFRRESDVGLGYTLKRHADSVTVLR
jgi:hypothetical protein